MDKSIGAKIKNFFVKLWLSLITPLKKVPIGKLITRLLIEYAVIGLYIALDLLTKKYLFMLMDEMDKDVNVINGVLRFTRVYNTGSSFGIFQGKTDILAIISVVTVTVITIFHFFSAHNGNFFLRGGLTLVIAGGIGNLVDRFTLGYVRDFIYVELIDFAVFNFADAGLVVGMIFIVLYVLFFFKTEEDKKRRAEKRKLSGADNEPKDNATDNGANSGVSNGEDNGSDGAAK